MPLIKPPVTNVWADAGEKTAPTPTEILDGWPFTGVRPSRKRFNWILNFLANGVRFFARRGVTDWDAAETYEIGDIVRASNNMLYKSRTSHTNQNPVTATTHWRLYGLEEFVSAINGCAYQQNAIDANNDIDFAAGYMLDTLRHVPIRVAALTKQIDVPWAVGNNAGMLDTGTIGNNDYWLHAIGDGASEANGDYLASLSRTAPTLPGGYTVFRPIGWVRRSGGINVAFTTIEKAGGAIEFKLKTPSTDVNLANTLTTARSLHTLFAPVGVKTKVHMMASITDAAVASAASIVDPDEADYAPTAAISPLVTITAAVIARMALDVWTNTSAQVAARSSIATMDAFTITTYRWEWSRL